MSTRRMLPIAVAVFLCAGQALAASTPESPHPQVTISNGVVTMSLYLPDPVKGYYRGSRFDWSGVVSRLTYKGHEYFGEWQESDDPLLHDRICGPVESFQTGDLPWGYEEAAPGKGFVKIGIGVLEKPAEPAYRWNGTYTLLDPGTWKVRRTDDAIEFRHELAGPRGMAYRYTKTIRLTGEPPGFTIDHVLENTGARSIETSQYNHNFFTIDRLPSGPDVTVRFPFPPKATHDLKNLLRIEGTQLGYQVELRDQDIFTGLEGFGSAASDHEIVIENRRAGAGVRISVDRPLFRLNFWSIRTTVCPENYVLLRIAPGAQERWKSTYVLYTIETP